VQLLLDKWANVNVKDNDGQTALLAAKVEYTVLVKLLLKQDSVDPDLKDKDNRTPLLWAVENGYKLVVELLLLDKRTNVEAKDE